MTYNVLLNSPYLIECNWKWDDFMLKGRHKTLLNGEEEVSMVHREMKLELVTDI